MRSLITKYVNTPKQYRVSKILDFITKKIIKKLHSFLFLMVNRHRSTFYLSYRPNFDIIMNDFKSARDLNNIWVHDKYINYGDIARLYFFYTNIVSLLARNIIGDFAELGVYKGNSAKLFHALAPDKKLYLFDTFEGFSELDSKVDPAYSGEGSLSSFKDTSLDYVRKFIGAHENVIYCKGYFPDTAALVPMETKFAFVHLDCDLYRPTKAGCEFFYPRLTAGGMLVVHDYYSGWPGVTKAVDDFFANKPESPIILPDKSGSIAIIKHKN